MITGTIGLVLAIGSDAVIIYQQYTGQSSGTPVSEVVKEELVTVERAAFAQRYLTQQFQRLMWNSVTGAGCCPKIRRRDHHADVLSNFDNISHC